MAVRPIRVVGDPGLRTATRPVTDFDQQLADLVEDMFDTMEAADGVGLAANQIGLDLRVFVFDCEDEVAGRRLRGVVVNPELETSPIPGTMPDPDEDWEGCLSAPGLSFPTGRADWARVRGQDATGATVAVEGRGTLARCLQHETDHLDGVLFLDRLVGRHARAAKRAVRDHGWGVPGLSWDPASAEHPERSAR